MMKLLNNYVAYKFKSVDELRYAVVNHQPIQAPRGLRQSTKDSGEYGKHIDVIFAGGTSTKTKGSDYPHLFHDLKSAKYQFLNSNTHPVDICSSAAHLGIDVAVESAIEKVKGGITIPYYVIEKRVIDKYDDPTLNEELDHIVIKKVKQYTDMDEDAFRKEITVKPKSSDGKTLHVVIPHSKLNLVFKGEVIEDTINS